MRGLCFAVLVALLPGSAAARNVEAGELWVHGGVGLDFKLGSSLGGSGNHFVLNGQAEYAVKKALSVVGGLDLGLAGTKPLRLRIGARYRFTDLGLPVSPYGQAQLSFGKLYNVIGADLTVLGVYVAGGADYFLTARLAVGGQLGVDLMRTFPGAGGESASFGTFEILATAAYKF